VTVTFRSLGGPVGALVEGLAVDTEIDSRVIDTLGQGLVDHSVLVFRGQEISASRLVDLGRAFGELEILPEPDRRHRDHREIFNLSNVGPDGELVNFDEPQAVFLRGTQRWHTDSSFREVPCLCTMLYAVEVPAAGGETLFADMYGAYAELMPGLRRSVDDQRLVHSYEFSRANNPGKMDPMSASELAQYPPVSHPWVRNHADGRRSLYMGTHVSHVDGMPLDQGRELIESVLEFATGDRFVYQHVWERNDLVIWDNRSTLHRLVPYDIVNERRVMRRITVAGTAHPE